MYFLRLPVKVWLVIWGVAFVAGLASMDFQLMGGAVLGTVIVLGQVWYRRWDAARWAEHLNKPTTARWAPDPSGVFAQRYWNGTVWTDAVSNDDRTTLYDPPPVTGPPQ